MIGKGGKARDLHRKNRGQLFHASDQPFLAVITIPAREIIGATQNSIAECNATSQRYLLILKLHWQVRACPAPGRLWISEIYPAWNL